MVMGFGASSHSLKCQAIVGALLAVWLGASAPVGGQQPSASVAGRVVAAARPDEPVPRAIVSVISSDARVRRSGITDNQGRFAIAGLPPGQYTVSASTPAFLTAVHGARRPGLPGTPIALSTGERVDGLILALVRGAAVSGTVRDADGAPMPNLHVTVLSTRAFSEQRVLSPFATHARTVTTNHRGTYRAYELPPGEYVILAMPPTQLSGERPVARPSTADVDATLALLERRTGAAPGSVVPNAPRRAYTQIFYPGTPLLSEAIRIAVDPGDNRDGLDFTFDMVPAATIAARIVWPAGLARNQLSVSIAPMDPTLTGDLSLTPQLDAGDGLTFAGVTPGRYQLIARAGSGPDAWASEEVLVNGSDISGITLVLQPTLTMSGRLVTGGGEPPPSLARTRVALTRSGLFRGILRDDQPGDTRSPVQSDNKAERPFTIAGIVPGVYSLSVVVPDGAAGAWWLESATAGGRDLLDVPLEFGASSGNIEDAILTLTDRRTGLTGRLQTPAGMPATDYFVIIFSADRAHWFAGARRTRAVRPATDGMFSTGELPAGAYFVAAVTDASPDEWPRADFLEQLAAFAVPVTVRAGETARQDLQLAAWPAPGRR